MVDNAVGIRRRTATIGSILVYHDGPQVLTLSGKRSSIWIAVAVDDDRYGYALFCTQISREDFDRYMRGNVDLRYLFLYSKIRDYRVTDLAKQNSKGLLLEAIGTPPESWFPDEGFFSRSHTEDSLEKIGQTTPQRVLGVPIDGEWEFPDFSEFSEKMSECYSFLYSVDIMNSSDAAPNKRRQFKMIFERYPWRGGASPLNFYNDLYHGLPANDRLGIKQIQYASPGHIEIRGSADIFNELTAILHTFAQNYSKAGSLYRSLHQFLASQKILSASAETIRGSEYQQTQISTYLHALAPSIGFRNVGDVLEFADGNWVLCAKIMLSFFRRLNRLFQFYAEGRASLANQGDAYVSIRQSD